MACPRDGGSDTPSVTPLADNWCEGWQGDYRFQAKVFAEPAADRSWEVRGDSRISKLWVLRLPDRTVLFDWDRGRGIDRLAEDPAARRLVEFLCDGLADHLYPEGDDGDV